jgi:septal ring factor EnvC (AmiA/AmiB activator)
MNKLGKIAPIVVILACAASLFFAYTLGEIKKTQAAKIVEVTGDRDATKTQLTKTQGTLKQTQSDLAKTKSDLDQTTATLVTTKASLDQKTQEADALATQLSDTTNLLQQTKSNLAAAQDSLDKIKKALEDAGFSNVGDVGKVRDKILSLGEENKVLGEQLATLHGENEQLKQKIVDLTTTPVGVHGRVSVVQGKWGFIVLDVGHAQKVQPNTEFLVYRDSKLVSKVKVVSVADQNCVAQISPDYLKHPPLPGDLAVH